MAAPTFDGWLSDLVELAGKWLGVGSLGNGGIEGAEEAGESRKWLVKVTVNVSHLVGGH